MIWVLLFVLWWAIGSGSLYVACWIGDDKDYLDVMDVVIIVAFGLGGPLASIVVFVNLLDDYVRGHKHEPVIQKWPPKRGKS